MSGKEKILMQRVIYVFVIVLFIVSLVTLYSVFFNSASFKAGLESSEASDTDANQDRIEPLNEPDYSYDLITLTIGGTCTPASMFGSTSYGTFNNFLDENGESYFFRRLFNIFINDDLTFAGCNAVMSDRDDMETSDNESKEWFRAPEKNASLYSIGGIDAVSLACPRMNDYGSDGYLDTVNALDSSGTEWCGEYSVLRTTMSNGIRCVFYPLILGNTADTDVIQWISEAQNDGDFIVIYASDSAEGYIPDDNKIKSFHSYIDAGADLVVGTNCKNLQRAEEYNGGYIAYSLGSLIDGSTKYPDVYTALLRVYIKLRDGYIFEISYEVIPCYSYDEGHSWSPVEITDTDEKNKVFDFMSGKTDSLVK